MRASSVATIELEGAARVATRAPAAARPPRADIAGLLAACRADGLALVRVRVPAEQVVFVVGVLEASNGLAAVLAEGGGELTLVCHPSALGALERLLGDLAEEVALDFALEGAVLAGDGAAGAP